MKIAILVFLIFCGCDLSYSQTKVDSMILKKNCPINNDRYKLDYLYSKFVEKFTFQSLKQYGYGGNFYLSTIEDIDKELGLKMKENSCSIFAINFSLNDSVGDQNFGVMELLIDSKYTNELNKRISKCECYSLSSESPLYFEILTLPFGKTYIIYSDIIEHNHAYFKEVINYLKNSN